jgi:hypothetical protein
MNIRFAWAALLVSSLVLVGSPAGTPTAQQSPLLQAMEDEMRRSVRELRLMDEPAPYFIEYEVDDLVSMRVVARLGGIVDDLADRGRALQVQVRVGDYAFDSSRFITQDRGSAPQLANLPMSLDDDYDAMRRQIWLTTDAAYKHAVSVFAKKKATFQNRAVAEDIPDLSLEEPVETVQAVEPPTPVNREWIERAREISASLASVAGLDAGEVWLSATYGNRYYLNSEGFKSVRPVGSAYLQITAEAQVEDGSTVRDMVAFVERRLEDLPSVPDLLSTASRVAEGVTVRRAAAPGEEFTGPVLVEGQATGELIAQTLVPLMLATRPPDAESQRLAQQSQSQVTPFLRRIGLRVLTDSFSARDMPSLTAFEGRPVAGAYVVDDEGVPAQDVTLVERGRLLTLLTSRTPQRKLPRSNGHGRAGGPNSGVFELRSSQAIPAGELKGKYLELLKLQDQPFGYIVRSIAPPGEVPSGPGGGPVLLDVVKVLPDGTESPVRGLRFGEVPSTAFRDILEASVERTLHNYRLNVVTPASVITPSLIFEELEIERTREIIQKPPAVPPPPLVP